MTKALVVQVRHELVEIIALLNAKAITLPDFDEALIGYELNLFLSCFLW